MVGDEDEYTFCRAFAACRLCMLSDVPHTLFAAHYSIILKKVPGGRDDEVQTMKQNDNPPTP